jgi:hypothetical protein
MNTYNASQFRGMVPYIASWSSERRVRTPVVMRGRWGIGYQRERPGDRDARGVLWTRNISAPGEGTPQFGSIHPARQRRAMRRLLCQVCGAPADQNEHGVLWLMSDAALGWSGEEMTGHPPVCLRCAGHARRACPHLRRQGTLAMRVRDAPITGVFGKVYRPGRNGPAAVGHAALGYDDPRIGWLQAYQLMRALNDWTEVDLDQELSAGVR